MLALGAWAVSDDDGRFGYGGPWRYGAGWDRWGGHWGPEPEHVREVREDLAADMATQLDTSAEEVEAAFRGVVEQRLGEAVADGRIDQAQADDALAAYDDGDVGEIFRIVEGGRTPTTGSSLLSSRFPSLLVVDDDEAIRTALERALTSRASSCRQWTGGRAALEAVAAGLPDLLVLDVVMPDVDGVAVARTLRDQGRELPILILSALDEVDDRVAGLQAGADDYLVKPFAVDELVARAHRRTGHRRSPRWRLWERRGAMRHQRRATARQHDLW